MAKIQLISEWGEPLLNLRLHADPSPEIIRAYLPKAKILDRSKLIFVKEYFNAGDNCTDRVYHSNPEEGLSEMVDKS